MEQSEAIQNSEQIEDTSASDSNPLADENLDLENPSEDNQEEDEEIEVDGKKFALPKSAAEKLKAERMMQSDYTKKTQEVAENRKAIEADREQFQASAKLHQEFIKEVAEIVSIEERLQEYAKVDWAALTDSDPITAMKLDRQMRDLQAKHAQASQSVTQKQQQQALNEQQSLAKRVQEAEAFFEREIPNYKSGRGDELLKYATSELKIDAKAIARMVVDNPALATALHKAEMFDKLKKQQASKQKTDSQAAPVTRLSAVKSTATKDPAKMTDKEFAAMRAAQIRNRK